MIRKFLVERRKITLSTFPAVLLILVLYRDLKRKVGKRKLLMWIKMILSAVGGLIIKLNL